MTREEAISKLKKLGSKDKVGAPDMAPVITEPPPTQREPKKSILSKMFQGGFFKKKGKEEQKSILIQQNQDESSEEDPDERKKEKLAFEIDSDDEDDNQTHTRDAFRRITLLKDQFDKFNIQDDFDFGEMYRSVVDRAGGKFDFSESMH
jgi:hypothetical protein